MWYFWFSRIYSIKFKLNSEYVKPNLKLELDLGKIGNIGEVFINEKKAGTVWMTGQQIDISHLVVSGDNALTVLLTNTNINRVSSFKKIIPVPETLIAKYGEAKSADQLPGEFGFKPLPPSGLIGPVVIKPVKVLKVQYKKANLN